MSENPAQDKLVELASELVERTKAGAIKWKGDSTLTSFSIRTTKGSVVITSRDDDGQPPFILTVLNSAGQAIEWLSSEWWDTEVGSAREPAPWNDLVEDLYRLARSTAVDLEGVIGGILEEVENPIDDDIPF